MLIGFSNQKYCLKGRREGGCILKKRRKEERKGENDPNETSRPFLRISRKSSLRVIKKKRNNGTSHEVS